MPFTFAHPAAVLPLKKHLGSFGVLTAMVIGSMTPDFVYFVPIGIDGRASHSIPALFWFCMPSGLFIYLVFHRWLRQPLVSLLPRSVQTRIVTTSAHCRLRDLPAILVSLFVGAVTHLAWDSFTHANSPWQSLRPILDLELFAVGSYQVFVFRALQHSSSILGMMAIAWWIRRWHASTKAQYPVAKRRPAKNKMIVYVVITTLFAGLIGVTVGYSAIGPRVGVLALQYFAVKAIVTAVPVFVVVFLGYCVWWHSVSSTGTEQ